MKKLLFALLVLMHSGWIQANTQYTDTLIVDDVALTYDGYKSGILQRAKMQLTIHTADCFSSFSASFSELDNKDFFGFYINKINYTKTSNTIYIVELDDKCIESVPCFYLIAEDNNSHRKARSTVLYTVDYIKDSTIVNDLLGLTSIEDIPARSLNIWYKQGVIGVNGITADEIADLSVYDATGKRVAGSKHETTADVSHLCKGIYIVRTRTKNNQIKTKKITL